LVVLDMRTLL